MKNKIMIGCTIFALVVLFFWFHNQDTTKEQQNIQASIASEETKQEQLRLQADAEQKKIESDRAFRQKEHNRSICEQKLTDVQNKLDDEENYEGHIIGDDTLVPRVAESLKVQLDEIADLCPELQSAVSSRRSMIRNSIK